MNKIISEGVASLPDSNAIIDRFEQRDAFTDVLERMRSNMPFQHNLFEWYGAPGIGKTTLVKLLQNECEKRNVPWAVINFDEEKVSTIDAYLADPIKLVEHISIALTNHNFDTKILKKQITSYKKEVLPTEGICLAYARMSERERAYSESNPQWLYKMRLALSAFVDAVSVFPETDIQKKQLLPFVLFIDGIDSAPELLTDWIEEFLIKPLVQTKRSIIVWTARNQRKWKRPEIRWDRKSEELRPFSEEEVKLQLRNSPRFKGEETLTEQLFKNVFILTGGHPYAGSVVINEMGQWEELNAEAVKRREQELLTEIYKTVIQNYAFKGLSIEQKTALEFCSMVRLIDTTTLQRILQESSSLFENKNDWQRKDFDRLLFELRKTYLLRWEKSGWTIEPTLRHLMRNYFLTCAEDVFQKVNESALNVYQDWLSKPVDNRKLFIIEEIYHLASLQQIKRSQDVDIVDILKSRLEQYRPEVRQDPESWRITLVQIEGELEHDVELTKIVGEPEVERLISPIKDQMKSIKQATEQKNE